jgi:hypothetical protein
MPSKSIDMVSNLQSPPSVGVELGFVVSVVGW